MSDEQGPATETLPVRTFDVQAVYGARSRRPYVRIEYAGESGSAAALLPVRDALQLGMQLIGAAHASIGDAAMMAAIGVLMEDEEVDPGAMTDEEAGQILRALRVARQAVDEREGTDSL